MLTDIEAIWHITFKESHIIRVLNTGGVFTDRFEVFVDDVKILTRLVHSAEANENLHSESHKLTLENHLLEIRWLFEVTGPLSPYKPTSVVLLEGAKILAQYGTTKAIEVPTVQGLHKTAVQSKDEVQLDGPLNITESIEIIDIDEFPMDNRHGTDVVVIQREISKTVINEVELQTTAEVSGEITADILTAVALKIAGKLSKQTKHTFGETVTLRDTLTFTVQPGKFVIYTIVWKRKVQKGEYAVAINQLSKSLPYSAYFDLSYDIKSKKVK